MAAIAPMILTDLTLDPQKIDGDIAHFLSNDWSDQHIGKPRFTASIVAPSKKSKYTRVRMRLVIPVLEPVVTVGSAPVLAYENFADVTFTVHERANLANRTELSSIFREALAHPQMQGLVVGQQNLY